MGMTAARLRERRALSNRIAPPPTPARTVTTEERLAAARAEITRLRGRISELELKVTELSKPATSAPQSPQPDRNQQKRRG